MSTKTNTKAFVAKIPKPLLEDRRIVAIESAIAIVLLWQLAIVAIPAWGEAFTTPRLVAIETYDLLLSGRWIKQVWITATHTFLGFFLAVFIGTGFGISLGWSNWAESAFSDFLTLGIAMPSIFIVIFSAMWFGIGDTTPIVAVALGSIAYMGSPIFESVKNLDQSLLEMGQSFDISGGRTLRHMILPSIMPGFFAGIRYSLAHGWKVANLAEFIAAEKGVGFQIRFQMRLINLEGVFAWVLLFLGVLLFMEYVVFYQLEKRVFSWRDEVSIGW